MGYLPHTLHDLTLVYTESLDRHSFIVTDALPNVAISTGGDRVLSCLDKPFGKYVGSWKKPHPATELPKLPKDRDVVRGNRQSLFRAAVLRISSRDSTCHRKNLIEHFQQFPRLFRIQEGNICVVQLRFFECSPQSVGEIVRVLICAQSIESGFEGSEVVNQRGLHSRRHRF